MKTIRTNLEQLVSIVKNPRLYLAHHFSDLKNQVDIDCQIFLQEQTSSVEGIQATQFALENQRNIINQIDQFENECFNCLDDSNNFKGADLNGLTDFNQINEAVFDALLKIQTKLFLKKTYKFFGRNSEFFKNDAFTSFNFKVNSFGMLIIVEDQYVSDQGFLKW